jgi:hypothetical protein
MRHELLSSPVDDPRAESALVAQNVLRWSLQVPHEAKP